MGSERHEAFSRRASRKGACSRGTPRCSLFPQEKCKFRKARIGIESIVKQPYRSGLNTCFGRKVRTKEDAQSACTGNACSRKFIMKMELLFCFSLEIWSLCLLLRTCYCWCSLTWTWNLSWVLTDLALIEDAIVLDGLKAVSAAKPYCLRRVATFGRTIEVSYSKSMRFVHVSWMIITVRLAANPWYIPHNCDWRSKDDTFLRKDWSWHGWSMTAPDRLLLA